MYSWLYVSPARLQADGENGEIVYLMLSEDSKAEWFSSLDLPNKHSSGHMHGGEGARVRLGRGGDTASEAADRRARVLYLECLRNGECAPLVLLV